jgi:AraC-like DNA-binding protein
MVHNIDGKSIYDPNLPVWVKHIDNLINYDYHSHNFTEIVVVAHGTGVHIVNDQESLISPGDIYILHGDVVHAYKEIRGMEHYNIMYNHAIFPFPKDYLEIIPGYKKLFPDNINDKKFQHFCYRMHFNPSELAKVISLADGLIRELSARAPGYEAMVISRLTELVAYLSRLCRDSSHSDRSTMRLHELVQWLDDNFSEPISLSDMAEVANLSETTVNRYFHNIMGLTPWQYLLNLRIDKASVLLEQTDDSATDIALSCGFNDSNYFSRQFHNIKGITPTAYRRGYREKRKMLFGGASKIMKR